MPIVTSTDFHGIFYPGGAFSLITALRWAARTRRLGHRAFVDRGWDGRPCDVLVALHAEKSAAAIRRWRAARPEAPLVVAATGTDIYGADRPSPEGIASFEQATSIARRMVREWGMSERVGPMAWSSQQQVFLGEDLMSAGREYSDDTAKLLDEEVARILTDQEQRATELISKHLRGLQLIAEALLEHETIDGPEVAGLIQQGMTESGQPTPDGTVTG